VRAQQQRARRRQQDHRDGDHPNDDPMRGRKLSDK
jgi:hypothetical protein